jgi:enoyl-CoA hydratase/carnithine racemase
MTGEVRVEMDAEGVAWVTIDREAKLNSLNPVLMREFVACFAALSAMSELRAVVLTGAGYRAFVGGADIHVMAGLADAAAARHFIGQVHACCQAVRDCPVPVIARICGWTLGAGLELAASCDLRIAADTAQFGMPELRVGIPSVIEAALLPGLIGWGRTRRLLLLGETIDAFEAERWGLVERAVEYPELDATVEAWLAHLAAAGPRAMRLQKALIRRWEELPMRQAIAAGVESFAAAWESDEPRHMLGSFARRAHERER